MNEYKKNQIIELSISDMGSNGEGIGKTDGFTFFVKNTLPGDVIEARVLKVTKNYGFARVEKLSSPSPFRVTSPCQVQEKCGGCQFQAFAYDQELKYKENKVFQALKRIGGFSGDELLPVFMPIIGSPTERYRNKAMYPVGTDSHGNLCTGFYAPHSHNIIPCVDCLLEPEINSRILATLLELFQTYEIQPYDETKGTGLIRHIALRHGMGTGEISLCLVINGNKLPHSDELTAIISEKYPGIKSISLNINKRRDNVLMGTENITLLGKDRITDSLELTIPAPDSGSDHKTEKELLFHISPLSFYQINHIQTEKLYSKALEFVGIRENDIVWDLYCGIGAITLSAALTAGRVYGIETVPEAIEDARENAALNGLDNVEFFCGNAEDILAGNHPLPRPDVVIIDPPRKGCDPVCIDALLKASPRRIVYVSCDPSTLARDLKLLCSSGYELTTVQPVDMFARTKHVETVVLMSKVK